MKFKHCVYIAVIDTRYRHIVIHARQLSMTLTRRRRRKAMRRRWKRRRKITHVAYK